MMPVLLSWNEFRGKVFFFLNIEVVLITSGWLLFLDCVWRIPCVFPVFLWNKGFSARSFWCFHADAHGFSRGFGSLNPSIIGVEGVFSAGGFLRFFLSYCPIFFHSGTEDVGHGVYSYKKISVKGGAKQCGYYLISWGRGEIHGDYFISYDTLIPIIEGLRQPKPRKNPCASAAKHQKDRAENDSKTLFSIQNT